MSNRVADDIKRRRRIAAGLEQPKAVAPGLAGDRSLEGEQQRELEGGIVLVGRHTFKEYMEGFRRGWSESVYTVDREDQLARGLQNDGVFDEKDEETLDDHSAVTITPSPLATQSTPKRAYRVSGLSPDVSELPCEGHGAGQPRGRKNMDSRKIR